MLCMPRIDDSHAPFKRKRSIGPGPKKHPPIHQVKKWVCERVRPTERGAKPGYYTQICRLKSTGAVRYVRRKKPAKKRYNKLYRAWAAKHRARLVTKPAIRSYRCRRTRVARCA